MISRKEIENIVEREKKFRKALLNDFAMVGTVRSGEYKGYAPCQSGKVCQGTWGEGEKWRFSTVAVGEGHYRCVQWIFKE